VNQTHDITMVEIPVQHLQLVLTSGGIRMVSPDTLAHQTIKYE